MPYLDMDTLLLFAGRWWCFQTASLDLASAEFEFRDSRLYLLQPDGSAVESIAFAGNFSDN